MQINRSERLDPARDYFGTVVPKSMIVLHHTVGGTALSTIEWWREDPLRIGTAYIIDRDETIYEVFPPECWAAHLKVGNQAHDRRSIGIELCNWGPLQKHGESFYAGRLRVGDANSVYYVPGGWKRNPHAAPSSEWWQKYPDVQVNATLELIDDLCKKFGIARRTPNNWLDPDPDRFLDFQGIIAHFHVRIDKTDVSPAFPRERLAEIGVVSV